MTKKKQVSAENPDERPGKMHASRGGNLSDKPMMVLREILAQVMCSEGRRKIGDIEANVMPADTLKLPLRGFRIA